MQRTETRLTDLTSCGGCAAKYPAARLEEILAGFAPFDARDLLDESVGGSKHLGRSAAWAMSVWSRTSGGPRDAENLRRSPRISLPGVFPAAPREERVEMRRDGAVEHGALRLAALIGGAHPWDMLEPGAAGCPGQDRRWWRRRADCAIIGGA